MSGSGTLHSDGGYFLFGSFDDDDDQRQGKSMPNVVTSSQITSFHSIDITNLICLMLNCRHAPKIEQCLYPPIESLKGCSSSVGHKDLELVKSSVHQAMRYACHNKGQRITG